MAELVRLVGQTRRRLWIAAARALAARDESIVAWALVNRLAELGPLTQRELADASAQHPAGVSRQLGELERKGLTTRGTDPDDRRRRRVELTTAGHGGSGRPARWWTRPSTPVLAVLRPNERRALSGLLRQGGVRDGVDQRSSIARSTVQSATTPAARPSHRFAG